ncbi:SUMF1/EgtB/PvdO family nonheme iron enzyme [Pseudomonas sp.]|uniref:SUMF1/EgtB/PvdO family nonheme iron enzyme n=1 Tax=Pseudomonas sp. TaxID=306 RepID=UPI00260B0A65|nr:SUMF1/EgtB/PvdO family nonheme iron enzyme [Pseudomonas sp.]
MGAGADGFSLGHEQPQHLVSLAEFSIADRLVSNEEWLAFMADGGYERAQFWSAEGWDMACQEGWHAPLYWESVGDSWMQKTLGGLRQLPLDGAVRHVSYFEAEAYANWAGARLPTEQEWEHAAPALAQVYGDVWQWTSSRYRAYVSGDETVPEIFAKNLPPGASMVLRGGASVTAPCHTRVTYRNVEHPATRTMFTGLRLARCG